MNKSEYPICRVNDSENTQNVKDINWILDNCNSIAVVGLSPKSERPSNQVSMFLKEKGYKIIPVRPAVDEILGEKAYPDLENIPDRVDLVLIFRRSECVPAIVEKAIKIKARAVWMQEGIINEKASRQAMKEGLKVVMDSCMSKEVYRRK
ncbi:CoA-binding protein [Elusimicrobiota bacterium]